ncbi:Neuropeptide F receptor [Halotydeus destructor]|nr:Neuropeptide F receptor [Halotydeus destructor]
MVMCSVGAPLTLVQLLRRSWSFGSLLCQMAPLIQGVEIFVSALTVSAIALDRLLRITGILPSQHQWRPGSSYKSVIMTTVITWSVAFILSLPVAISYDVISVGNPKIVVLQMCMETWPPRARIIYTVITFLAQLIFPTLMLSVSYFKISSYLETRSPLFRPVVQRNGGQATADDESAGCQIETRETVSEVIGSEDTQRERHTRSSHQRQWTSCVTCVTSGHEMACVRVSRQRMKENKRNKKAIVALIAVWLSFMASWLPWNLVNLYAELHDTIDLSTEQFYLLYICCHLIALSSATTNAILYGWLNSNIRKELIAIKVVFKDTLQRLLCSQYVESSETEMQDITYL